MSSLHLSMTSSLLKPIKTNNDCTDDAFCRHQKHLATVSHQLIVAT
ncbi:hypothetical protein AB0758_44600 [Tolypothrix bouteillei VB521301_2]